ncbi:MAG TPA: 50S ribosomal protein L20 [Candidatus Omnitrophota bacterium]|jgi:large subunit ribosomal protein L20|nr:50S ribosomal protein L20 [Candidatus Omnitrophota bacterium]
MPKAKTVPAGRRRHKKFLKRAKGFVGGRRKLYRTARESVQRAMMFATRDRRDSKSVIRKLWITRISAGAVENGLTYSRFIGGLKRAKVQLDRKILAELAYQDKKVFSELATIAKG